MTFSIASMYWGNQKNLDAFIDHCLQFTDDVVIVFIDLFGKKLENDKATIVYLDHTVLLERGYAYVNNIARSHAKYDWVFLLDTGKEIVKINSNLAKDLPNRSEAGFLMDQENVNGSTWVKLTNIQKTSIVGVVHEEPLPIQFSNGMTYPMSEEIFATFKYASSSFDSEAERNICSGYRTISRLKWYYLYKEEKIEVKPQSLINSMRDLEEYWKPYGENFVYDFYSKYSHLYNLNRQDLIDELSVVDEWKKYPI